MQYTAHLIARRIRHDDPDASAAGSKWWCGGMPPRQVTLNCQSFSDIAERPKRYVTWPVQASHWTHCLVPPLTNAAAR
jgi:hypothetical protein